MFSDFHCKRKKIQCWFFLFMSHPNLNPNLFNVKCNVIGVFLIILSHTEYGQDHESWRIQIVSLLLFLLAQIKDYLPVKDPAKFERIVGFFSMIILKIIYFWKIEVRPLSHIQISVQRNAWSCKNFQYKRRTWFHIQNTLRCHELAPKQHVSSVSSLYRIVKEIITVSSGTSTSESNPNLVGTWG